jgi:hypothetical protein
MYYNICPWRTLPFLSASPFFALSPFLFLFVPMLIAWGSTHLSSAHMSCYPYVALSFSPYIYNTLIYHTMLSTSTCSIYRNFICFGERCHISKISGMREMTREMRDMPNYTQ